MFVATPPSIDELFSADPERLERVVRLMTDPSVTAGSGYPHWDRIRHLEPPQGVTHEEWWFAIKMGRAPLFRPLPLEDPAGQPFVYSMPDEVLQLLHFVDQRCSGEIAMPEVATADDQARRHYLVNSLMEEAIRSSQLEGAQTSRQAAKELLRSGRRPKDRSERMIANNYTALQFMREVKPGELNPQVVLELHRILTEGTLSDATAAGRLQTPADARVAVYDSTDGTLIHRPPPAEQLPARFERMCAFGNGVHDSSNFMHPVVRAILLHFWLAYDHPFEDGNGRTARALFYWSMRAQGYWLTEYLSISRILREAPARYSRSFVLTETDRGDTTYFILYQLHVVKRAVEDLHKYLQRKVSEVREIERLMRGKGAFNHRQLALLGDAVRHADRSYTFKSHAASHNVTHETARNDLLELQKRGLLDRYEIGQRYVFTPAAELSRKLRETPEPRSSATH